MQRDVRVVRLAPKPPDRQGDGVYDLQDMMDRCFVDEVSHCWEWRQSAPVLDGKPTPRVGLPPGLLVGQPKRATLTAHRAAYLLAGNAIRSDYVVWRTCLNDLCINPGHLKAGPRSAEGLWRQKNGYLKGDPVRQLANRKNVSKQALPPSVVREVEAMLADRVPRDQIAAAVNASAATISKISQGRHLHQRQSVSGFSVFAWRPGA